MASPDAQENHYLSIVSLGKREFFRKAHFSHKFRGENVSVQRGFLSTNKYTKAHGQCIMQEPLTPGQTFQLSCCGTGVIKLGAFPSKKDAVNWLESGQHLGKFCKPLRFRIAFLRNFDCSLAPNGRFLELNEKERLSGYWKAVYQLQAGPYTVLGFDIAFGDVEVSLSRFSSSFCPSFHQQLCSHHVNVHGPIAKLKHDSPTSLICLSLRNNWLSQGASFRLRVSRIPSEPSMGYFRVCVSPYDSIVARGGGVKFTGSQDFPEVRGQLHKVKADIFLMIEVVDDTHVLLRTGWDPQAVDQRKEVISADLSKRQCLVFELFEVSLEVWKSEPRGGNPSTPTPARSTVDGSWGHIRVPAEAHVPNRPKRKLPTLPDVRHQRAPQSDAATQVYAGSTNSSQESR